jgi:cyclic pyranopterin monophosphate synthase
MPLTHFDEHGASRMVDTSAKSETVRTASASGIVVLSEELWKQVQSQPVTKGDVLEVARIAAIMATKQTGILIPLCHPLPLSGVTINFNFPTPGHIRIEAEAKVVGRTGVEMEALTAVSIAALTIYDMCKSHDKAIIIERIQLESKSGGKSGNWQRS